MELSESLEDGNFLETKMGDIEGLLPRRALQNLTWFQFPFSLIFLNPERNRGGIIKGIQFWIEKLKTRFRRGLARVSDLWH